MRPSLLHTGQHWDVRFLAKPWVGSGRGPIGLINSWCGFEAQVSTPAASLTCISLDGAVYWHFHMGDLSTRIRWVIYRVSTPRLHTPCSGLIAWETRWESE